MDMKIHIYTLNVIALNANTMIHNSSKRNTVYENHALIKIVDAIGVVGVKLLTEMSAYSLEGFTTNLYFEIETTKISKRKSWRLD